MLSFRASLKTQRLLPHLRLYDEKAQSPLTSSFSTNFISYDRFDPPHTSTL